MPGDLERVKHGQFGDRFEMSEKVMGLGPAKAGAGDNDSEPGFR